MPEPPTLPPGQVLTRKFPVVGEKAPAPGLPSPAGWVLTIDGLVGAPCSLRLDELLARPIRERVADIHCVTGWSRLGLRLEGWPLADLLEAVRPQSTARFVRLVAHSERTHDTTLPLALAAADTWVVHRTDGAPLTAEHGGPLRTVTPSRYFYKSLKWLTRIELLAGDQLGYWERESHYHNEADPWAGDQRFVSGSVPPAKLHAFREAERFDAWHGPRGLILSADLAGWAPRTRALGQLELKNCDLRGAQLDGVDLEGANLSLSDLRGASLVGAKLRGADLEGVRFAGADLTDADLSGTALSATSFFEVANDGTRHTARIEGLRWDGASGLLEDQEAFLRGAPASQR
jgi:DMSO/TMAO reductase YedYZ molybdopterin-dependent catalytic subunit